MTYAEGKDGGEESGGTGGLLLLGLILFLTNSNTKERLVTCLRSFETFQLFLFLSQCVLLCLLEKYSQHYSTERFVSFFTHT